jgi:hypothetical protein
MVHDKKQGSKGGGAQWCSAWVHQNPYTLLNPIPSMSMLSVEHLSATKYPIWDVDSEQSEWTGPQMCTTDHTN